MRWNRSRLDQTLNHVFRCVGLCEPFLFVSQPLNAVNYQKLQCWPNVHLHYSLTNISTKSVNADQEENNPWEYSTSKNDDVMAGLGAGHVRR